MQTLIIGNGFDIDHNLPTKYKDFLCFIEEVNVVKGMSDNKIKKIYLDDSDLKTYIKQLFLASEKTQVKNEVISLLEANMWIDYFLRVKEEFGDNWIDFESEISQVVQELENGNLNLEDSIKKFEEGMAISKKCNEILEEAEKKITVLIKKDDGVEEENFE